MSLKCNHQEILRRFGILHTRHREQVLHVFLEAPKALTVKTILNQIHSQSEMDKVTLYRILDLFVDKKLLRRIVSAHGTMAFEIRSTDHHPEHPHFICQRCGDMECLNDIDMRHIKKILNPTASRLKAEMDIKLEGICPTCQDTHTPPA